MKATLDAFGAARYLQHAYCLTFDPWLMWLYVGTNFAIFLAAAAIGAVMFIGDATPIQRRRSTKALFACVFALGAVMLLFENITMFAGVYLLEIVIRCSLAALITVLACVIVGDAFTAEG